MSISGKQYIILCWNFLKLSTFLAMVLPPTPTFWPQYHIFVDPLVTLAQSLSDFLAAITLNFGMSLESITASRQHSPFPEKIFVKSYWKHILTAFIKFVDQKKKENLTCPTRSTFFFVVQYAKLLAGMKMIPVSRSAYQTGAFTIYETPRCITESTRTDTPKPSRWKKCTAVICLATWRYPCEWRLWHADRQRYSTLEGAKTDQHLDFFVLDWNQHNIFANKFQNDDSSRWWGIWMLRFVLNVGRNPSSINSIID